MRKTGFIAIVGLANAGKSTLLNALIKQKISIVSPKPQTTRDSIMGVWTDDDSQIVFVDTPGFLHSKNALGDYMLKSIDNAVQDVDCILIVIDGHNGISEREISQIAKYRKHGAPIVVAVTKTDITQPQKLMPELAKLNDTEGISEVYCVSAKRNKGVEELKSALKRYLKGTQMFFEEDDVTDKSQRYLVCEIIREKVLLCCDNEIPHGVGVALNKMQYENDTWDIDATILVEKASHKPIVLGKNGSMIKGIGTHARESIEKLVDGKVFLTLWIKVKEDWRNNASVLNELGYSNRK
ncbi:MAG: GTPase Era [Corallococcus sp.]|nr:GTPase Era [Corallococcus sp.]MCM1359833.1 GTPase Era [Corallococcus sp.]MCM1395267.1 GTPase Era [Corallococcus sp.]